MRWCRSVQVVTPALTLDWAKARRVSALVSRRCMPAPVAFIAMNIAAIS